MTSTRKTWNPILETFPDLIKWITVNDHRHPREVKSGKAQADKQEVKVARVLRLCRYLDKQGELPENWTRQLDEVCIRYAKCLCWRALDISGRRDHLEPV